MKFVELLVTEENRRQKTFNVSELLILAHIWRERQVEPLTITKLIQRGDTEARTVTENLVESGLVEARGSGKGRSYILSAGVYRQLGQAVSYVHAKGFETEQMEQMILQYAKAHGKLSKQDAMELCRINENQAVYIIKKLVNSGKLLRVRMGRNAAYQSTNSEKREKNSE